MLDFVSSAWSHVRDWVQGADEFDAGLDDRQWTYYVKGRAVLHGLPIAAISTVAAAFLFNCANASTGAIFGVVNYLALTSLLEIIRAHHEIDKTKAGVIIGISGAISMAFIQTVCKTNMTYYAAIILGTAAFAGQLTRLFYMTEE
jgi:hypothetical protein